MNPYAQYLDGRDPIAIMSATPVELQRLLSGLTPETMDQPTAPGKWSVREILAHLADCELNWATRIRQVLASPGVTILPFDQDIWAMRYSAYSADAALKTFLAVRTWNLELLTTVSDQEKSYPVTHPERGTFPLSLLLEVIAGHDRNHIVRLEEIVSRTS